MVSFLVQLTLFFINVMDFIKIYLYFHHYLLNCFNFFHHQRKKVNFHLLLVLLLHIIHLYILFLAFGIKNLYHTLILLNHLKKYMNPMNYLNLSHMSLSIQVLFYVISYICIHLVYFVNYCIFFINDCILLVPNNFFFLFLYFIINYFNLKYN